jgi:hypothetical protein
MFDQQYPHLTSWILDGDGWIELGQDDFSRSLVRILDIGGMIWESDERYATLDRALAAAEQALVKQVGDNLSAPASASSL